MNRRLGVAFSTSLVLLAFAVQAADPALLRVSTHSGRLPLEVTLTGDLSGVNLDDMRACYINVEWSYTTPGGSPMNAKTDLPCTQPGAKSNMPVRFEKLLTLTEPGTYLYRIVLEPNSGRRQAFTTQEVRAYRGPFEASVAVKIPF